MLETRFFNLAHFRVTVNIFCGPATKDRGNIETWHFGNGINNNLAQHRICSIFFKITPPYPTATVLELLWQYRAVGPNLCKKNNTKYDISVISGIKIKVLIKLLRIVAVGRRWSDTARFAFSENGHYATE